VDIFDEIEILHTAVDSGRLSEASRRLDVSPVRVTRAIAALETRVGERLLDRSRSGVAPTAAGRRYLAYTRGLEGALEGAVAAAQAAHAGAKGRIVVSAPVLFGRSFVLPLLRDYLEERPDLRVDLRLSDRLSNLTEEGVDIAFRIAPSRDSSFVALPVAKVRRRVVGSPGYLDTVGRPKHPRELASHSIVVSSHLTQNTEWRFRDRGRALSIRIEPRLRVDHNGLAISLARGGVGLVRALSYQVASDVQNEMLEPVLEQYLPAPVPVCIMFKGGARAAGKVRSLVDMCAASLRADPRLSN
jgi:DNA-binding transcriptional LysR family regulator